MILIYLYFCITHCFSEMHQILAILFNLTTVIWFTINSYTKYQTLLKPNAETSMITKLLLTLHLLGHLIAWITICQYLNEFTYISIGLSVLICLSVIKLGNKERQPWIEAHLSLRTDHLYINALFASWITPAAFLTYNSSKLLFKNVSTLQRKIKLTMSFTATALLQLVHLSSIALLMKLTDVFEPSTNITEAR
jgi:hypothetical protein